MKNNLVFRGIPEHRTNENTKEVLIDFMVLYLKIDPTAFRWTSNASEGFIWTSRCHRFGKSTKGEPRPIVAVFVQGLDIVLKNARNLAGTKYSISSQLPPELNEEKRMVQPIYKNAKNQGKRPKYVGRGTTVLVDDVKHNALKIPPCTITVSEILKKTPDMNIHVTHPVTDQGNRFTSHIATVSTPTEISMAVSAIKHTAIIICLRHAYSKEVRYMSILKTTENMEVRGIYSRSSKALI